MKIAETLNNIKGFIDVSQRRNKISEQLKKVVTDNPNYKDFINKLNALVESHPFLEDEDFFFFFFFFFIKKNQNKTNANELFSFISTLT